MTQNIVYTSQYNSRVRNKTKNELKNKLLINKQEGVCIFNLYISTWCMFQLKKEAVCFRNVMCWLEYFYNKWKRFL